MALINDLPNEILRQIILHALPILPADFDAIPFVFERWDTWLRYRDPLPVVYSLSSVCPLWRATINDMPRAWSTIVAATGYIKPISILSLEAVVAMWSTSTVIDFHFRCYYHDEGRSKHPAKLLLPFRSQIRILNYRCEHYHSKCFLPFLFGHGDPISLPLLRSLNIHLRGPLPNKINGRANYIDAPNLARLRFLGPSSDFESAFTKRSFYRIQHLSIDYQPSKHSPAIALSSSSLLSLKWFMPHDVLDLQPISFPNIRQIEICQPDKDTYNWDFLDLFDAPKLQALTIAALWISINSSLLRGITFRHFTCLTRLKVSRFKIDHIAVDQITKACPKLEELVFFQCQVESFLADGEDSHLLETGIRWIIFDGGEISEIMLRTLLVRLADREKLQPDEARITVLAFRERPQGGWNKIEREIYTLAEEFYGIFLRYTVMYPYLGYNFEIFPPVHT
ncbi:hypothetical protein M422DRAFT_273310 [Sphaerobolus stellatus SS14]|uniref:F-box domain-containing protein n=1 Tax=Sphaerobolus stellatus (strain SS14) TaxID=990650 RepID=A0A0C9U9H7_SPHS4|nr:hypothetical protein M422DRAFT_273310 [Sphaerobolus stellatus SS14]